MKQQIARALPGILLLILMSACSRDPETFTHEEQCWLKEHEGELEILFGYEAPPNAFHDEDGRYVGLLVDCQKEIEKHLGMSFAFRHFDTWNDLIEYSKTGRNFVVVGIARTDDRARYLSFTDSFIKVPYVIVVRKDSDLRNMEDLEGAKVCAVDNYAVHDYIKLHHPQIKTTGVMDNLAGLRGVSTGEYDAMVLNQMYASYLIQSQGLSNLLIAGESGYLNRLSVATSINDPRLFSILDKAVDQITPARQKQLYGKWVGTPAAGVPSFVWISMAAALALLAILWLWTVSLKKQVNKRTSELKASKDRFESAIRRAPIPMVVTDTDQNIIHYNEKFIETFGYTLEDITTAEKWWDIAYPDDAYRRRVRKSWEDAVARAVESGEEIAMQTWDIIAKDESAHTVEFKMMPLGEISLIVMNDITDQTEIGRAASTVRKNAGNRTIGRRNSTRL
jgi:PAS domain S-box-containing protein